MGWLQHFDIFGATANFQTDANPKYKTNFGGTLGITMVVGYFGIIHKLTFSFLRFFS
jgi:hypothetical protein